MGKLLRMLGWEVESGNQGETLSIAPPPRDQAKLRAREEDARERAGAGPAGRALRPRERVAARRLRRSARGPSTSTSRASRRWAPPSRCRTATSRGGPSGACAAPRSVRHAHGHGHREPDDGRGAREGPHHARERAREPEVEELARVLNKMGARIEGAGTDVITSRARDELSPVDHAIMPDRIEAGTYMVAAAATYGDVLVEGARSRTSRRCRQDAQRGRQIEREGTAHARAWPTGRCARSTSPRRRTPASPRTCRRSSWC
jgi:hypothetical protein